MTQGYQPFPLDTPQSTNIVKTPLDLAGELSSDIVYFIDGEIDLTGSGVSIEVPPGGLTFDGNGFNISSIVCSDDNYTMFTSPAGGSGDLVKGRLSVRASGANSKVYDLTDSDGTHAIEINAVNYIGCTSLGEVTNYRQWLEVGTGRFGNVPSLTLSGAWAGGFRATTTIVRGVSQTSTEPLFKAGAGFVMQNRFLTDINADLGATMSLFDFQESNFPNPSTIQLENCIVSRNGAFMPDDGTVTPNIDATSLSCDWSRNIGVNNTYVGGRLDASADMTALILIPGDFVDFTGSFNASMLVHFDQPANGQLRHLGNTPREYIINYDATIEGRRDDQVRLRIMKFKASDSTIEEVGGQTRQINNLAGGRDVAFFDNTLSLILDENDYIFIEATNLDFAQTITLEAESFFLISER